MDVVTVVYMLLPIAAAGVLFHLATRIDLFAILSTPVSDKLFGSHKTWRGFLLMPLLGGLMIHLSTYFEPHLTLSFRYSEHHPFLFGFVICLAGMLSELPNSYWKRRKGIAPGKRAERHAWLHVLIDTIDIAPATILVAWLWTPLSLQFLFIVVVVVVVLKIIFNLLFYALGIRKEPF